MHSWHTQYSFSCKPERKIYKTIYPRRHFPSTLNMITRGLVGSACGLAEVRRKKIKFQRQQSSPECDWFVSGSPSPCELSQYCAGRIYGGSESKECFRIFQYIKQCYCTLLTAFISNPLTKYSVHMCIIQKQNLDSSHVRIVVLHITYLPPGEIWLYFPWGRGKRCYVYSGWISEILPALVFLIS